jgi:hypothetical protein
MAPLTPWPTKKVTILAPDASNIQAWLGAVEPIITFHSADDLTQPNYVLANATLRGLVRQFILFLAQTTDPWLKCCITPDDPAGLKALRPANDQAIEDAAEGSSPRRHGRFDIHRRPPCSSYAALCHVRSSASLPNIHTAP